MRYISEYSRRGLVNRLAEKISQKLSENEKYYAAIEVVDCINFLVVKGYTSNQTILNLVEFKEEFIKNEKEFLDNLGLNRFNMIDVINYKEDIVFNDNSYWFEFYNSKRPMYNSTVINMVEQKLVEDGSFESIEFSSYAEVEYIFPVIPINSGYISKMSPLTISSHFPFGYSLGCGKTKFYYSEYICNQLFSVLNTNKIMFKISNHINEHGDFDIEVISDSQYFDGDVKSMILDIFDFNLTKFQTDYLKDYNFIDEITKPFETKPWINKDKVKELMIV